LSTMAAAAALDIRQNLDNLSMEQMSDCFYHGTYECDFELDEALSAQGSRRRSVTRGTGQNSCTMHMEVFDTGVNVRFRRAGGAFGDREDRGDTMRQTFNDNFFECIEDANQWVDTLFVDVDVERTVTVTVATWG
jgi:hypothetical protein